MNDYRTIAEQLAKARAERDQTARDKAAQIFAAGAAISADSLARSPLGDIVRAREERDAMHHANQTAQATGTVQAVELNQNGDNA